jgi:hypothetical protein
MKCSQCLHFKITTAVLVYGIARITASMLYHDLHVHAYIHYAAVC